MPLELHFLLAQELTVLERCARDHSEAADAVSHRVSIASLVSTARTCLYILRCERYRC